MCPKNLGYTIKTVPLLSHRIFEVIFVGLSLYNDIFKGPQADLAIGPLKKIQLRTCLPPRKAQQEGIHPSLRTPRVLAQKQTYTVQ